MTLVKGLTGFDLANALTKGQGALPGPSTTLNVSANTNGESRSSDKILEQPPKK
jgi:hypothetical protein